MAKRSDFAQKLLDDLRLRKERIAASQSSNRSKPKAIDAYAYSKQTHKGSRDMKTLETIGARATNTHNRSTGSNRFSIIEEASKQIVPYARGQGSEQIGDLSMALTFAIENGRILRTDASGNNPMLGFLQQIGRRSTDIGKIERSSADRQRPSSNCFPTLSHLHIEEISKGAQKLNQILKACSGGLNFDRYSIEIGKELLKGAMDLEESLRMLVNLQEASEHMVNPNRKNRIVLLEEDEDNEDNISRVAEQKQLDRPRFSFDKSSRHSPKIQEVERNNVKQRLKALTYATEAANNNLESQALITFKSASQKQSASYGPDIKILSAFPQQKNHSSSSQSKPEKGRISSVIAKLMGLDDIPHQGDTKITRKADLAPKQKAEGVPLQHMARGSTKNAILKTKDTTYLESPQRQKVTDAKRNHVMLDQTFVSKGGKNLPTRNASIETIIHNGNSLQKDMEQIQRGTSSEKASLKTEKQQNKIAQLNQNARSQKNIQDKERKQDDIKNREQKGTGMGKTKEPVSRQEMRQMDAKAHKRSEAAVILQGKTGYKESMLQPEKRYVNKLLLPNNQEKSQNSPGLQQQYILQKPEQQGEKNQGEEREQQITNQKLQMSKQRGRGLIFKSSAKTPSDVTNLQKKHQHMNQVTSSKKGSTEAIHAAHSEGFPNGRHHEDLVAEESSPDLNFHMKALENRNSEKNFYPSDPVSQLVREKARIPPFMEGKPVYVPATQKEKNTKAHKSETPRKIDEVATRRNGTLQNFVRPSKQQSSILQEVKPRRNDKFSDYKGAEQVRANMSKEAESHIVKSNKSASSIQPLNVAQLMKEAEKAFPLYSPSVDGCQSLEESVLPPKGSSQNMVSKISYDQEDHEPVFDGDEENKGCKFTTNSISGTTGESRDISYPSLLDHRKVPKSGMHEPLTESENFLKQILITSELFLNTAEALFKLNIPFDVFHASGTRDYQDEESKLILDCVYEVMRRKGRRQELTVNPCIKLSTHATKVKSLEGLIKQLHKDYETLKFYGRNGNPRADIEDYLPKMLEIDVHNGDPDVNCMWDVGWNDMMFALLEKGDVIRDVEKHVLSGLIEDITRDLLPDRARSKRTP
ncbi:hypothetical protein CIPAW_15G077700 [Carya illinoinensis]|nr:hypothetical protein CIPAW_15G077700 [Carya illinoinensis]